jgi:hypothetical protein
LLHDCKAPPEAKTVKEKEEKGHGKKLLFAAIVCCGPSFAQQQSPVRSPFFQGEALPTPPQQNAPWLHGDDALSKAAAPLFDEGLADPRGLEY